MKCPTCGADLPANIRQAKFCTECGAKLPESAPALSPADAVQLPVQPVSSPDSQPSYPPAAPAARAESSTPVPGTAAPAAIPSAPAPSVPAPSADMPQAAAPQMGGFPPSAGQIPVNQNPVGPSTGSYPAGFPPVMPSSQNPGMPGVPISVQFPGAVPPAPRPPKDNRRIALLIAGAGVLLVLIVIAITAVSGGSDRNHTTAVAAAESSHSDTPTASPKPSPTAKPTVKPTVQPTQSPTATPPPSSPAAESTLVTVEFGELVLQVPKTWQRNKEQPYTFPENAQESNICLLYPIPGNLDILCMLQQFETSYLDWSNEEEVRFFLDAYYAGIGDATIKSEELVALGDVPAYRIDMDMEALGYTYIIYLLNSENNFYQLIFGYSIGENAEPSLTEFEAMITSATLTP